MRCGSLAVAAATPWAVRVKAATGVRRLHLLRVVLVIAFAVVAVQAARLQWWDPAVPPGFNSGMLPRIVEGEAPRGLITDRNGVVLAHNVPRFAVVAIPGDLPADNAARARAVAALADLVQTPVGTVQAAIDRGRASVDPLAPVTIATGFSATQAIALVARTSGTPGVRVIATPARVYTGGALFAQVLGHVGLLEPTEVESFLDRGYPLNATVGRDGVERVYESWLRGTPERRLVLATPAGREVSTLGGVAGQPGVTLVLSLDGTLQAAVTSALASGMAAGIRARDQGPSPVAAGAAVMLDVRTGEVLALASLPAYDANLFGDQADPVAVGAVLEDPMRPLVNRSFMEAHAPGSIFKPLVAMAALDEGIATPDTMITSTGAITVQDVYNPSVTYVFRDWAAHGRLNLYQGIARSSDVYFYYLAGGYSQGGRQLFTGLGPVKIADYARASGLGRPTGIDLPGETDGLVPDPAWKERAIGDPWYLGDTYTYGIGQGYLTATPLQMAVLTAAIANGGDLVVPRVVRGSEREGVLTLTPPRTSGRLPNSSEAIAIAREAMRQAAAPAGTARTGQPAGVVIGGKTGTAEFGQLNADGSYPTHAWYIGFAPYDRPEVAVAVYLEHGVGSTHAGPVARAMFEAYFAQHPASVAAAGVRP